MIITTPQRSQCDPWGFGVLGHRYSFVLRATWQCYEAFGTAALVIYLLKVNCETRSNRPVVVTEWYCW